MSEKTRAEESRAAGDSRLPYEPPAITWTDRLQAQASLMAGCAKVTDLSCTDNPPPQS